MQVCDCVLKLFDVTGVLYVHDIVAFTISPSSQVVGVGQMAVFRCQNQNALVIFWRVNETQVTFNNPHPDPADITISTTMDENNAVVNLLSIIAQSKYNETAIICIAVSIGGNSSDTTPVKLLIEGEQAPDRVHVRWPTCIHVFNWKISDWWPV